MKNLSFLLNIILLVAVLVLFYFHFSGKKCTGSEESDSVEKKSDLILAGDSSIRISAYINTDSLFEKFLFVKKIRDELAAERLKSENGYNLELKKLEKEVYEFQEKASQMSQQEGEAKQYELAEKEQKLMRLERDLSSKLADLEMEKNSLIQKAVSEYLVKFSEGKNFEYIFGYNGMGNVLYANPKNDITNEIIDGLNEEYNRKISENPDK